MILQPILPWWGLVLLFAPFVGFVGWQLLRSSTKQLRWQWLRRAFIVLLAIVMSVRPSLPGASSNNGNALLDVFFVVDTTVSMSAEDYNDGKQRIEGVRDDVKQIAKELAGARFSLITFNNATSVELPLTSDTTALSSAVDTTAIQIIIYGTGSSIDAPVERTRVELERISQKSPGRGRVVFYLGDGEQTTNDAPGSFAALQPLISGGAVLGYGSESGGRMYDVLYDGTRQVIKDYTTNTYPVVPDALSYINEDNLRTVAGQMGVPYYHRSAPGDITSMTKEINIGDIIDDSREVEVYNDIYWLFASILVGFIAVDVWHAARTYRSLRTVQKRGRLR
ncbi:VWA domain-containing protein [Candidatus Saccharibacteria bacterium]|nr:VWA domain-containing protein [Candidatus Saccharibacteria bacterium]